MAKNRIRVDLTPILRELGVQAADKIATRVVALTEASPDEAKSGTLIGQIATHWTGLSLEAKRSTLEGLLENARTRLSRNDAGGAGAGQSQKPSDGDGVIEVRVAFPSGEEETIARIPAGDSKKGKKGKKDKKGKRATGDERGGGKAEKKKKKAGRKSGTDDRSPDPAEKKKKKGKKKKREPGKKKAK